MDAEKLSQLTEILIGMPIAELERLSGDQIGKLSHYRKEQKEFDNAVKDFITIVLNTDLIGADEDRIRVRLISIVHMLEAVVIHVAITSTNDEFNRRLNLRPLAHQVVQLLRQTATENSSTEESRIAWRQYPSAYQGELQDSFRSIVNLARTELRRDETE